VYIVLPNSMHREFTERAAQIGKHVLCEKPMATSAADARSMVAACTRANVKLMTAYRIHYQPHNMRARQFVQEKTFGRLVTMSCTNVQSAGVAAQWRAKKAMAGGGALVDVGIYCLNTARYVAGEEPNEVMAWMHSPTGDARFSEVEATMSFILKFPSGLLVNCQTSYDAREDKTQRLNFNTATVDMPDAYSYQGQRMLIGQRQGNESANSELQLGAKNQFAAEIDHMAECILDNKVPNTPGEEGVKDMVLIEALYKSATTGQPVKV
jgi:predicted dehydrogenase